MIIRLPKLHTVQDEIARKIIDSDAMYGIVCTSRQFGKSYLLKWLCIYYAGNNPNSVSMFVSMSYSQLLKVFKELSNTLKDTPLVKSISKGEWSIELVNGSTIIFKSFQNLDYTRGFSVDFLFCDEIAFCKEESYNAALKPVLTVKGKKCILVSTPRGKNWFYKLWAEGQSGNSNYISFKANYRQNPFANIKEVEDAKRLLPEAIFKSEYEADFVDGALSVFKNYQNCIETGNWTKGKIIAGVDVGKDNDSTVLTVFNGNKVVLQEEWNKISYIEIAKNVKEKLKEQNVGWCYVEYNGCGSPFYDLLKAECRNISCTVVAHTTTNKNKEGMVLQLVEDFATGSIIIPNDEKLLFQLDNFTAHYSTRSRSVIYENNEASTHDDRVMSILIANYYRKTGQNKGVYAIA